MARYFCYHTSHVDSQGFRWDDNGLACLAFLLRSSTPWLQVAKHSSETGSQSSGVKTSVMMWTLNKSGTFEQNLELVAQAGYNKVELVSEFKSWSDSDTSRILARMKALRINVDAMAGMTLGFAVPTGGDAFVSELKTLIPIARRLGCGQIILLSGKRIASTSTTNQDASNQYSAQHTTCIATLKRAAKVLTAAGFVGVIEPIDRLENPSIYLDGVTEAFALVNAVGSPAIRVLYDLYHEQRTHGNLYRKARKQHRVRRPNPCRRCSGPSRARYRRVELRQHLSPTRSAEIQRHDRDGVLPYRRHDCNAAERAPTSIAQL